MRYIMVVIAAVLLLSTENPVSFTTDVAIADDASELATSPQLQIPSSWGRLIAITYDLSVRKHILWFESNDGTLRSRAISCAGFCDVTRKKGE